MRSAIYIFILFGLVACGENSSKSEVFLRQIFDNLTVAMTYDDVCTGAESAKSVNANLFGTMQMIVTLYTGEIKYNRPDLSQQDVERMVLARRDDTQQSVEAYLIARGCDSDKGQSAKKFLEHFNTLSPAAFHEQIAEKLKTIKGELHNDPSSEVKIPETH